MTPTYQMKDVMIYKRKSERTARNWKLGNCWILTMNAAFFAILGWKLARELDPMSKTYSQDEWSTLVFLCISLGFTAGSIVAYCLREK